MASIQKRKSKYAVVYTYYTEDGEKKQKWETWGTLKEAKKRKAEIEYQQGVGNFVMPTVKTISDLLYEYVNSYGVNTWAVSTYSSKKAMIDNYINPLIGDMNLQDATPRVMDEFYRKLQNTPAKKGFRQVGQEQNISARGVKEIHKILNSAFNLAVAWEYVARNPVANATLPKVVAGKREIWTAETVLKALELCDDERLALCINLSFACSLRIGEICGLTWDCIDISEESINANNASLYVEKELSRVSREAMEILDNRDIIKVFPPVLSSTATALVLKKPKTESSVRRVWLPASVASMLARAQKVQNAWKEIIEDEYQDYNMVITLPNGRPCEERVVNKSFHKLIEEHSLPKVVFHSLRHTSTTYKLKMNGGDMKAVQGDTGHAQLKMVSDVYSHILDEDRKQTAIMFENQFYKQKETAPLPEEKQETPQSNPDTEKVLELLRQPPELATQLMQALGKLTSASTSK